MNYPDIKTYHENRRTHRIMPLYNRPNFLGQDALDTRWQKEDFPVNIKMNDKIYEMEIAVPGFTKEEIKITVSDDMLNIRATKQAQKESTDFQYVLKEFDANVLERRFKLAKGIGHEKIEASYQNGMLKLTFFDVPHEEEESYKTVKIL